MSHVGWRPTTVTGLLSGTSVTMAPSRLTTILAPTSFAPEARGGRARRAQLVVHLDDALDAARDRLAIAQLVGAVDDPLEHDAPLGAVHHDAGGGGALVT